MKRAAVVSLVEAMQCGGDYAVGSISVESSRAEGSTHGIFSGIFSMDRVSAVCGGWTTFDRAGKILLGGEAVVGCW